MLKIENLTKSYGEKKAVNDLSFKVKEGEFFAFLGVNGAGKSTTINIICGQLSKDSGRVEICGTDIDKDPDRIKRSLGVVFQSSVLDKDLSVRDNLESRAALYGIHGAEFKKRLSYLSGLLEFEDLLRRPVGKLSGGQRRRIDIARALLHSPKILILDEPTRGIDVGAKYEIYELIINMAKQGKTVIVVSSEMPEILGITNRIGVMSNGRLSGIVNTKETNQEELLRLSAKYL